MKVWVIWGFLSLFFCVSTSSIALEHPEDSSPCRRGLLEKINIRLLPQGKIFDLPRQVTFFGLKSLAYPFFAAGKAFHWVTHKEERQKGFSHLMKKFKKDAIAIGAYLALLTATNLTTITYTQMDYQVHGIHSLPATANVVVVNGFSDIEVENQKSGYIDTKVVPDQLKLYPQFRAREWKKTNPSTEYFEVGGVWDMVLKLKSHVHKYGKIKLLEIHGHGAPGAVRVTGLESSHTSGSGEIYLSPDSLRISDKSSILTELERLGLRFELGQPDEDGQRYWTLKEKDIFEKDAMIVLYSCSSGRGPDGDALVQAVGATFLNEGGDVFATRVNMYPNILEQAYLRRQWEPNWVTQAVHRVGEIGFPVLPLAEEITEGTLADRFTGDDAWFISRLNQKHFPAQD